MGKDLAQYRLGRTAHQLALVFVQVLLVAGEVLRKIQNVLRKIMTADGQIVFGLVEKALMIIYV